MVQVVAVSHYSSMSLHGVLSASDNIFICGEGMSWFGFFLFDIETSLNSLYMGNLSYAGIRYICIFGVQCCFLSLLAEMTFFTWLHMKIVFCFETDALNFSVHIIRCCSIPY